MVGVTLDATDFWLMFMLLLTLVVVFGGAPAGEVGKGDSTRFG